MTISKLAIAVAITSFAQFIAAAFRGLSDAVYAVTETTPATGADLFTITNVIATGNGLGLSKVKDGGLSAAIITALEADPNVTPITAVKTAGNRWVFTTGATNIAAAAYENETRTSLAGWGELSELVLQGKVAPLADCTVILIDQVSKKGFGIRETSTKPAGFPAVGLGEVMQLEGFTRDGVGWGEEA